MKVGKSFHPYAIAAISCWSMAYVFTRMALRYYSPLGLAFLRYFIACLVLLAVAVATRMGLPKKRDLPLLFASACCGFSLYVPLFNTGGQTVTAATGSVVLAATPVVTALLARVAFKEKLSHVRYAAIAVSFVGVVVLTVLSGGFTVNRGLALLIVGMLLFSMYNLLQRRLTRDYSALQATSYSMILGTAMMSIWAPQGFREVAVAPPDQLFYLIVLGVVCSAASYCLWSKAMSLAENTASVMNYMFVTPFMSAILGFFIAGEAVERSALIGGLIIISGLLLFNHGDNLLAHCKNRRDKGAAHNG